MLIFLQVVTIAGMLGATFFVYQALGPRRADLTFSREDKRDLDELTRTNLGTWLTMANVFASLTSLATVYVFFIGNLNAFGGWIFASIVTMWLGAFVTNRFTGAILRRPHIAERLSGPDQSSALLPALFLDGTPEAELTARMVRWVTLVNIFVILWLEFAVFADVSSRLVGLGSPLAGAGMLFVCAFVVILFTLRFGLRGFVLADLFHSPLIVLGTIALLIGAAAVIASPLAHVGGAADVGALLAQARSILKTPRLPIVGGILFCISCLFLNAFLVLVTQPHWLRMWIFEAKETRYQVRSLTLTCLVWSLLIAVGVLAAIVASLSGHGDMEANEVVVFFLQKISNDGSPAFAIAFWVAGMAALFSSSDAQIYSFALIERFDCRQGRVPSAALNRIQPVLYALAAASVFALLYWVMRAVRAPFDQIVLVLLPSCLIIVPPFIFAVRGLRQIPAITALTIAAYTILALLGLRPGQAGQLCAVAAPVAPLVISLFALFAKPKEVMLESAN